MMSPEPRAVLPKEIHRVSPVVVWCSTGHDEDSDPMDYIGVIRPRTVR